MADKSGERLRGYIGISLTESVGRKYEECDLNEQAGERSVNLRRFVAFFAFERAVNSEVRAISPRACRCQAYVAATASISIRNP